MLVFPDLEQMTAMVANIMLVGMAEAVFLGILLLLHRRGPMRANRMMGALMLSIAAHVFVPYQYLLDEWRGLPHLVLLCSISIFLNGPLLFWYFQLLTNRNFKFQRYC